MPSPADALKKYSAVVLTGGSSGIGKSFIELFGKLRPDLPICNLSRRAPNINIPQLKLRHVGCDLTDPGELARGIAAIQVFLTKEAPPGAILLINNSGFGLYGRFPDPGPAAQVAMIDLNVRAVVQLTAELLPLLKARGGAVLTVASTAAFQPTPYLGVYGATKAFVLNWSLALNEELRGTGVSTLALCPGPTSTEFFQRAGLKEGSVPNMFGETSEKVVRVAMEALAAGKPLVVSGWKNKLMTFMVGFVPKRPMAWMAGIALRHFRMKQAQP